mgnify:FL=1
MKIPAIRAHIGDWVYYVATMRFKDVSEYVKRVDNELHKSDLLKQMLQRSITNNYRSIANYIETQEERFFNALVLAVYDGVPTWHEVRLEYDDGAEFYNLGVLELNGDEKIFPVDGQHRVEGIKKVVNESDRYNDEQIPVIFIGHKTDDAGMQRSRRLFSTLNRYAKPVSMRDIIALDEDDVVAIASRDLIDTHPLFARDRLLDSRTKAIPENNDKAFTTIITFYECNLEILWILLKDMDVLNPEGAKTKGKGKIKEFIRKRPNDVTIHQFEELCGAFWNALIDRFEDIYAYATAEPNAQPYRNRTGGNLLFRPVALLPFVRAAVKVSIQQQKNFDEIFGDFPQELLYIDNIIWRNTLWNSDKGTMIVNNQKLTERILLYYWDRSALTAKEISTMKLEIKSNLQLADMEDVETLLTDTIDK